jgi:tetratricopeptide (TPR) repeat protein
MEEADRLNFTEMKAKFTFLYAANLKHNYQKDVLSLYFLNKAAEYTYLSKGLTDLQKSFTFSGLSRIYYQFDNFDRAIQFGKEVEKRNGDKTETFLTLDVMATCYFKLQQYDSALIYFDKSLRMFHSEFGNDKGKRGWQGILVGQKGHVYKAKHEWDEAIRSYRIGIEDTYKNNLWDNTCGFAINLADIYLIKNQLSEATQLIPIARQTTQSSGNESDKFQLHEMLMKYYTLSGQINLILPHKDSAQYWSAVLEQRRGKNVQIQADLRLETERRLHLETSLNESIKQQQINRIVAIVIVGLLTVIAFVLVLRYQLLMKLKDKELKIQQQAAEKKLLLEQEKAKQQQLVAQLKLEEFTNIIIAKNKQIELLLSENDEVQITANIQQLLNNTLLTDKQWLRFKELFEQVHTGYLQRLREKIPSISPAEIRFMALAKLQLNTREMASSLGVSVNAVRNVWFRLRKKVDLPEEATWQNLADEI